MNKIKLLTLKNLKKLLYLKTLSRNEIYEKYQGIINDVKQ